jgi:hypothetical protein
MNIDQCWQICSKTVNYIIDKSAAESYRCVVLVRGYSLFGSFKYLP